MLRIVFVATMLVLVNGIASSQEYCIDRYNEDITKISAELGGLTKRQAAIDKRIAEILVRTSNIADEIAKAATSNPPDTSKITALSNELAGLKREKTTLENEGYTNTDRITALKGVIPADLQGRLRGCVEATAPVNNLVNLGIQALAILSTGGASLLLPPKTLYVDMSAVLNGYPTGGPNSIINEARESALNAIGAGGANNDLGKTIRDPGRIVRCLFGCD